MNNFIVVFLSYFKNFWIHHLGMEVKKMVKTQGSLAVRSARYVGTTTLCPYWRGTNGIAGKSFGMIILSLWRIIPAYKKGKPMIFCCQKILLTVFLCLHSAIVYPASCNPVLCTEIVGLYSLQATPKIGDWWMPIHVDSKMLAVYRFHVDQRHPPSPWGST